MYIFVGLSLGSEFLELISVGVVFIMIIIIIYEYYGCYILKNGMHCWNVSLMFGFRLEVSDII